ncbi:MAG: hypothetical protein IJ638_02035 [Alphaproteobacteria bacterium]|nr:hypothetical protein [Alphaproteobacteria bacterium]
MPMINEKSGLSNIEAQALLFNVQNECEKPSIFLRMKEFIERKKSEKLLKTKDICEVIKNHHR